MFCVKMFGGGAAPGWPRPATGAIFSMLVLRVLVRHHVDRRRELHVAADVVAVRVRVDDAS